LYSTRRVTEVRYTRTKLADFFATVQTEEAARQVVWEAKFDGKDFVCPQCKSEGFYQLRRRPEVRECRGCGRQVRLRAETMFAYSKLPMLTWLRMIYLMMQDKRGVSALHVKRLLGMKSYGTAWTWLHKIRRALSVRDDHYKLSRVVELDGANFSSQAARGEKDYGKVLVAVETKDWVDEAGRPKSKAGFAKVQVSRETKIFAQRFVDKVIEPDTMVNTDGGWSFMKLQGVQAEQRVMRNMPSAIDDWLPWVHRFISNAKTWIMGTHHGVGSNYLGTYLSEYTYRFNRRHDQDGLFYRALTACATTAHVPALLG
jgi:transposase-like protein